jgi:Mn-dependent DtxR family transcriptional regulator
MDCASGEKFNTRRHADKAAAWGYEQAIPEREELAALLQELAPQVAELANLLARDGFINHSRGVYGLADRARAAAERLRGGGSDG